MSLTPEQLKAFLEAPSSPTPEGVLRNLDKPDNSNDEAMALGVICIVFSTAAILARAYSRLFVIKSFRIEDCMHLFPQTTVHFTSSCQCCRAYRLSLTMTCTPQKIWGLGHS